MMQLSIEELRGNYEKEKAKLEEMKLKQAEPTPQGQRIIVGQDTQIDTSIVSMKIFKPVYWILYSIETLRKELEAHWMDLVKDVRNIVMEVLENEESETSDENGLIDTEDTVERLEDQDIHCTGIIESYVNCLRN